MKNVLTIIIELVELFVEGTRVAEELGMDTTR
jgi:hypothetical protein